MRRLDCHARIKQVKDECHTVLKTLKAFIEIAAVQPKVLYENDLSLREIRSLEQGVHDVYFVRMFACFESTLRDCWRKKVRDTKPTTEQLLSAMAGRFGIPQDTLDFLHEIREYRNHLIHQEAKTPKPFTVDEASPYLNEYLARLPLKW